MMYSSGDFLSTPNLDFEAWRDVVRSICGGYTPGGIEPKAFSGRARVRSICRFRAVDLSCNAHRLDRTHQDVRADARDHYYAIFQMTGQSRIIQNNRIIELTVGDVALLDAAERLQRARSVNSFRMLSRTSSQCLSRPKPTCVSPSTICWAQYSHPLIQKILPFIQTDCS